MDKNKPFTFSRLSAMVLITIFSVLACPTEFNPLQIPQPIAPTDGMRTTNTIPELIWAMVESATGYELQIAMSETALDKAEVQIVDINFYQPGTALAVATYYWRVRTVTGDERRGDWSAPSKLEIFASSLVSDYTLPNYVPLSTLLGTESSSAPAVINGLTNGTEVKYSITQQDGSVTPSSISITPFTGIVTIASGASEKDSGIYTVTASGQGNHTGTTTATIAINISTSYDVGGLGPAGGTIIYDKGAYTEGWRYLEAAPSDLLDGYEWGAYGINLGVTSISIGAGKTNTEIIVRKLIDNGGIAYAAKGCMDYSVNSYDDWFLPSRYELNELYKQRNLVSRIELSSYPFYWRSSEYDSSDARGHDFNSNIQYITAKYFRDRVRPVRTF